MDKRITKVIFTAALFCIFHFAHAQNVGVGTSTPATKLHVAGNSSTLRLEGLSSALGGTHIVAAAASTDKIVYVNSNGDFKALPSGSAGQVLTLNGSSVPTWTTAATTSWLLTGNTLSATEFIGTLNVFDFIVKTNNIERMRVLSGGNFGIGTNAPTEKLQLAGNFRFSGALMPNNLSGNAGQPLLSQGANTAPVWGPAILNTASNLGMGKYYVNGVTLNANTTTTITVTDANCVAGSYVGVSFAGFLPGTPAQDGLVHVSNTQTGAGQWVVVIDNLNAGTTYNGLSLAFWAVY
ncbi:MAG TPA: hypothetical protein VE978_19860 [Chitinophagales bacterium]|nr:hypothetical protein [Chitinophagales bacterium]